MSLLDLRSKYGGGATTRAANDIYATDEDSMSSIGRNNSHRLNQEDSLRQGLADVPVAVDQRGWSLPGSQLQDSSQLLRDALDAKLAVVLVLDPIWIA